MAVWVGGWVQPKYREETEAYITQLEKDEQVPEGKELVHPKAAFVVKTRLIGADGDAAAAAAAAKKKGEEGGKEGDKIFVNMVMSEKIAEPHATPAQGGQQWNVPVSLGPKRFEKDKVGVGARDVHWSLERQGRSERRTGREGAAFVCFCFSLFPPCSSLSLPHSLRPSIPHSLPHSISLHARINKLFNPCCA